MQLSEQEAEAHYAGQAERIISLENQKRFLEVRKQS